MATEKPAFVLGVDLDGTCADFYGALRPIAAEWLGVSEGSLPAKVSYGLAEWGLGSSETYKRLHRFAVTQRGLFKNIRPLPGAPQALRKLSEMKVRVRIITHRLFIKYFHQVAVQQTIEWLDNYDIPYWDLCFMKDKAAVGANLYVEDHPDNIEALRADGHPTIVMVNSTNQHMPEPKADSWDDVFNLVVEHHAEWQARQEGGGALPGE